MHGQQNVKSTLCIFIAPFINSGPLCHVRYLRNKRPLSTYALLNGNQALYVHIEGLITVLVFTTFLLGLYFYTFYIFYLYL